MLVHTSAYAYIRPERPMWARAGPGYRYICPDPKQGPADADPGIYRHRPPQSKNRRDRAPCKTKNRAVAHRQCHVHPAAAWQQQRRRVGAGYTNMPVARPRSPDGPPARQCAELQARRAGQTCRWQLTAALNLKYVYAHTKHGCGGIEIMNSGYPTDQ